jgi:hypothetical protein
MPEGEPWGSMERLADESRQALARADIVGRPADEARSLIQAVGLQFRPIRAGEMTTADFSVTRVTALIVDGLVHEARIG